jgi:phospholipid/cholesterol/gamma-HCH transport system permease protein
VTQSIPHAPSGDQGDPFEPLPESRPKQRNPLPGEDAAVSAGNLVIFAGYVIRDIPRTLRQYPAETVSQMGRLLKSNLGVLLFMMVMLGALIGITVSFLFEGLGLESYVSATSAVPILRGVIEIVFGWILAAKYGCGIVAELGAMRISDEIDAMEVMGVESRPFLVTTRVISAAITLPFVFVMGLLIYFYSSRFIEVDVLQSVSAGGHDFILYAFQGSRELIVATLWATITGVIVTLVACYYGYTADGGPVGVGRATAQAMLVNLVLISLVAMILAMLFFLTSSGEAFGT